MVGLAIGLLRFILEFSYTVPPCGTGKCVTGVAGQSLDEGQTD